MIDAHHLRRDIAADQAIRLDGGDLDGLVPLLVEGLMADLRVERLAARIDGVTYRHELEALVAEADTCGLAVLTL